MTGVQACALPILMDALVSEGDEGGKRLPKASVSCQLSFDPEISEWGNPIW